MTARLIQPSLTGGELAPELYGRVDIARYSTSLKRCRNFIIRPSGGVENRNGFYFCGQQAAAIPLAHRLVPFVYNTETSYVLFFGDGYIRFQSSGSDVLPTAPAYSAATTYAKDAYVTSVGIVYRSLQAANLNKTPATQPAWWVADAGLQISSPYLGVNVDDIRFTQSADILYIAHPDVHPQLIRRLTANSFEIIKFEAREGPFIDINPDESIKVAATGVLGTVTITSSEDIFTANAVGSLFYIETKNLGKIKPWVVGERSITVGTLRRSDGKTYKAVTVPVAGSWHETGPRQPIHENGRQWDGGGDTRSNGVDTWSSGIEWEYVDSGYGVVRIATRTNARTVTATVEKRLPAEVVGGVGAAANTWTFSGDGVTKVFAIAAAGYGVFSVTIAGVGQTPDDNYNPGGPGDVPPGDDPYDPCPVVEALIGGMDGLTAGDVVAMESRLELFDPETWQRDNALVDYSQTEMAMCYSIVTENWFIGECSDSAPIWTKSGGYMNPQHLMGQEILTSTDDFSVEPKWDLVIDIVRLGMRPVQHIAVGNKNFWFGKTKGKYILHHNRKPTP